MCIYRKIVIALNGLSNKSSCVCHIRNKREREKWAHKRPLHNCSAFLLLLHRRLTCISLMKWVEKNFLHFVRCLTDEGFSFWLLTQLLLLLLVSVICALYLKWRYFFMHTCNKFISASFDSAVVSGNLPRTPSLACSLDILFIAPLSSSSSSISCLLLFFWGAWGEWREGKEMLMYEANYRWIKSWANPCNFVHASLFPRWLIIFTLSFIELSAQAICAYLCAAFLSISLYQCV